MKKWISRVTKLAVVLALLSMFSTLAFAMQELTVNSTKLENGVEVEWDYLADYKGMDVWCAAYDGEGRLIAVKQADMKASGQGCRIYCDPDKVAYVKLFLLGENIDPAKEVKIPGQDKKDPQDHIHMWKLEEEIHPHGYFEPGRGRYHCGCGLFQERPIPAKADPAQRELVKRAEEEGLLDHIELTDLDEVTRLECAKLMMGLGQYAMGDGSSLSFTDISALSDQERDIVAAMLDEGIMAGTSPTTFAPDSTVTNAQVLMMLYRGMGQPNGSIGGSGWIIDLTKYMNELGILHGGDPGVNAIADKESTLRWMLIAREWLDRNGFGDSDPALEITNARFELRNGLPQVIFDYPSAATGDETYLFYVRENGGKWDDRQRNRNNSMFVGSFVPNIDYEMLIATEVNGEVKAWKQLDLKLNIAQGTACNASATFKEMDENGSKAYLCTVTGGTPNADFMIYIREEGNGSCSPGGVLDTNGWWESIERGDYTMQHIENGKYMIREFEDLTVSSDGKTCSFTARDTAYRPCEPERIESADYAVTNLRFERNHDGMLFLAWDPPAAAAGRNVEYKFMFYRAGGNGYSDWNGQTDSSRLGLWNFGNIAYEKLWIQTLVDGSPKGEATFEGNLLTITKGVNPNVELTYTAIAGGYEMRLEGKADTCYVMTYRDASNSIMTYSPVTDANGIYTQTITDSSRIGCIESGEVNVMEYQNVVINGASCSYTSSATGWMKCLRGYGYVVSYIETVKNDEGELEDYVTFWNGETERVIRTKDRVIDLLTKGDVFSYRLEIGEDGAECLADIVKGPDITAPVIGLMFGSGEAPEWIKLGEHEFFCGKDCAVIYVDAEENEGAFGETVELAQDGKANAKAVLNEKGEIAALFVAVNGTYFEEETGGDLAESGYVIDLSLDGKLMSMTLTVPETADPNARYTYWLYNSADETVSYRNADHGAYTITVIPDGGYYDSYRVTLYENDVALKDQTILGQGKLSKPMTVNDGALTLSGITVTKGEDKGDGRHIFYFTGLDTANYTYIFRSNAGGSGHYINENSQAMRSAFFDEGAYIRAATTVETANEYVMDISNKYEVYLATDGGEETDYAVSNIRLEEADGGYALVWDAPEAGNLWYKVWVYDVDSGIWRDIALATKPSLTIGSGLGYACKGVKIISFDYDAAKDVAETVNEELSIPKTIGGEETDYAVSNIRFEESSSGQHRLKWDVPETTGELRYKIYAMNSTGKWERLGSTRQNQTTMDKELKGTYTGIKIETYLDDEKVAESTNEKLILDVQKVERAAGAGVQFVYNAEKGWYDYTVTGLDLNATHCMICLREPVNGNISTFGMATNGDGTANGSGNNSSLSQILESGDYLIMEFADYNLSADGNTLSYTMTYCGVWTSFAQVDKNPEYVVVLNVGKDDFGATKVKILRGDSTTAIVDFEQYRDEANSGLGASLPSVSEDSIYTMEDVDADGKYEFYACETTVSEDGKIAGFDAMVMNIQLNTDKDTLANGWEIAPNAVVFVRNPMDNTWSVVNGARLAMCDYANVVMAYGNKQVNGFYAVELAVAESTLNYVSEVRYGYVTSHIVTVKNVDGETVDEVTFWNGENEMVLQTDAANGNMLNKGSFFAYKVNQDEEMMDIVHVSNSTAVTAFDGEKMRFETDSNIYSVTEETVILYVDVEKCIGYTDGEICLGEKNEEETAYINNVKYLVDADNQVLVLFFDVNNDIDNVR